MKRKVWKRRKDGVRQRYTVGRKKKAKTQIYLDPTKHSKNTLAYVTPRVPDTIFIGGGFRGLDERDVQEQIPRILDHEETHSAILKSAGFKASKGLDNISPPIITDYIRGKKKIMNPKTASRIYPTFLDASFESAKEEARNTHPFLFFLRPKLVDEIVSDYQYENEDELKRQKTFKPTKFKKESPQEYLSDFKVVDAMTQK